MFDCVFVQASKVIYFSFLEYAYMRKVNGKSAKTGTLLDWLNCGEEYLGPPVPLLAAQHGAWRGGSPAGGTAASSLQLCWESTAEKATQAFLRALCRGSSFGRDWQIVLV